MKNKCLFAISGGPDSMAMLDIYRKKNMVKAVIHVNYNHRKTSIRDKRIVKKYCHKHHLKLYLKTINPNLYKFKLIKNFEAWARIIRYEYFNLISKLTNTKKIFIAHHKDDHIETALMQLRKHHKRFFYGIKKINKYKKLIVYRPFIYKYWKNDLINYCQINNIKYGIDETNFNIMYERNYIRKLLLNQQNIKEQIYKSLRIINNNNLKLYKKFSLFYLFWTRKNFSIDYLKTLPLTYQKQILKMFLYKHHIKNISDNKILGLIGFINATNNYYKSFRINKKLFIYKSKNLCRDSTDVGLIIY